MEEQKKGTFTSIRNLDKGAFRLAKVSAGLEGKTIARWIAEAIEEKAGKSTSLNFTYHI